MTEAFGCGNCGHPTMENVCPVCGIDQAKLDALRDWVATHGEGEMPDVKVDDTFPEEWCS